MAQTFFEDLETAMYPSALLHTFGVNGKVSGSVGAIGEMSQDVAAVIHGASGCGFHYRYSARRRHQPFYRLFCSDLTESEIIYGGTEKLYKTVKEVWERYHPSMIMLIPTPVSDVLSEDIRSVSERLKKEGIFTVGIQSELFSHRDKNYAKDRLRKLAAQKITGDNRLETELKGCGFTEALYALVEQVMEPQEIIPRSVNIETVGWGSEGTLILREVEAFLGKCGVTVNCWIPSSSLEELITAPRAELNLVKRIRWARRMKEKFGTDYIHLGGAGRYTGLSGIALFYQDIGEKLGILEEIDSIIQQEIKDVQERTKEAKEKLGNYHCVLMSRSIQGVPFRIKLYAQEFGIHLTDVCLVLTPDMERDMDLTPELLEQLMSRVSDAIELYSPGTQVHLNLSRPEMQEIFQKADAVLDTSDVTLEGMGAPLVSGKLETTGVSFDSFERNLNRMLAHLETAGEKKELILGRMPFDTEYYPLLDNEEGRAAKEMWKRMWTNRKDKRGQ